MKKLILAATLLLVFAFVNAQSLDEIVKKYSDANKLDNLSKITTIKITSKTSVMGQEIPGEIWMKNPDKIKIVQSAAGMSIVMAFDGQKGYMINPTTGSNDPVEMDMAMVKQQIAGRNMFQNSLVTMHKNGSLSLEGEEMVNGKPAFKVKQTTEGVVAYLFIDKVTFLAVKASTTVNQGAQSISVDSYPSDYKETNGVMIPMKTTQSLSGMDIVSTIEKVEVNIPMADSVFKLK
jgi:outer membrane lipoprotein-sorting protein